jgi:hypothetical protein
LTTRIKRHPFEVFNGVLPIEEARNIQEEISYWAAKALFAGRFFDAKIVASLSQQWT